MEVKDILKYFPEFFLRDRKKEEKIETLMNEDFKDIYNAILNGAKSTDEIALKTNKSALEVMQKLTLMELEELIEQEIGKGFKIRN